MAVDVSKNVAAPAAAKNGVAAKSVAAALYR